MRASIVRPARDLFLDFHFRFLGSLSLHPNQSLRRTLWPDGTVFENVVLGTRSDARELTDEELDLGGQPFLSSRCERASLA